MFIFFLIAHSHMLLPFFSHQHQYIKTFFFSCQWQLNPCFIHFHFSLSFLWPLLVQFNSVSQSCLTLFFFSNPKEVKSLSLKYICTLMFITVSFRITKVWKQPKYCWLLFSHSVVSDSLQPHGLQHARFPCPSPSPRVCWNSCPLSQWYYPTISSSVISLFSWLQSLPASGSFPLSQFFASGGQRIGVLASTKVLPMNIQDWFPLGLTGLTSLQFKGLFRVFFNTTVQKHQSFIAQPSLWSNSHIHTWLLEKP